MDKGRPMCVLVTGRPGSGKTTLAKELGRRLWLPVVSRDEIKEGYVNTFGVRHDELPADTNGVVSAFFFTVLCEYLRNRVSVICESAFQHTWWAQRIDELAALSRVCAVQCVIDPQLAAERHLERGLADPNREFYHGDRRVALFRETGQPPTPGEYDAPRLDIETFTVSTDDGYKPSVERLADQLKDWAARPGGGGAASTSPRS
ncbi:MAG: AAA family ATPase [Planctomycetota bacterium]